MNKRAQTAGTASSTAAPGRKKVLIVGVIVAVLLLVIVLVFVGRQLVGKAIAVGGKFAVGEAGIAGTEGPSVGIGANLGTGQSIAFEFELTSPSSVSISLSGTTFVPKKDWGTDAFGRVTQLDADTIKVEYATLDYTDYLSGEVELGMVQFTSTGSPTETDFTLSNVKVWSLDSPNQNLITSIKTPTGETTCVASEALCNPWFDGQKDTKCSQWLSTLSTDELKTKLTETQKSALCAGTIPTDFNADLNKDGKISNDDVVIMQLALEAMDPNLEPTKPACGKVGEVYCNFNNQIWVCENLKSTTTNPGDLKC